ncbi:MAG: adenylate/guanylate cyclase domain-containing protein [Methyloceanibacter sp.]
MGFLELLTLATALLQREKRISCRALGRIFELDDTCLEDLKFELVHARQLAHQDGEVLVWVEQPEITVHAPLLASAAERVLPPVIEPPEPSATPAGTTPPEGERRLLTVMFCDLVGSTELSTYLDPEDLGAIIRDYQETCAKVIAQFDGYIAKYMGDGILVYFGYPKAHENEAERAVMSGLGIIEALGDFEPKYESDTKLAVRIGIATGLVVVGEIIGDGSAEEMTVVGETPNIAARLQALAKPNTMVISPATHKLIEAEFRCEDLGGLQLKGVAEPIHAWRVVGHAEAEHEVEESGVAEGFPLVGRDEEIGLLLRRLAQSKERLGQAVLISGEAGIGKSALAETVGAQAKQEGFAGTAFHFSPYYTNSALYPVIEKIKRRARWQAADTPYTKLAKLEQMLANYNWAAEAEEVVPLFAALVSLPLPAGRYPPLNLTPQEQKQRTLDTLVAWTLEEAERQPVFELWDDLHWADPTTLELLGLLINQAATASLLMVMTFRPEFIPPWPTRSHMTPITLSRLEGPDVEAMVTRLASGKALPAAVVQHIVQKTDGVPLYVEELTKMVLESGLLREESDRYDLTGPLSAVTIPATLQESLMARLDRLPKLREVAQLGAVLGREFEYEMLKALAPMDEARLQDGLSQLVEAELLYQRGRPPQAKYIFKHALIQDAAYQSLLKRTRQQCHRQVADILESRFPEIVETQPELLAHHHTEANSPQTAVEYWLKAGQQAVHRFADREAVGHLEKGLDVLLTLPDTPERARLELTLQTSLGPALMATKGYAAPAVGEAYRRARDLCQQLKEITQLFPVLWGLWMYHLVRAEHEAANELTKQLLGVAQTTGDPDLALEAHFAVGLSAFYCGELLAAREHLEQAISAYDPERHRELASTYGGLDPCVCCLEYVAWTLWLLGFPDQALNRADEAQPLAKRVANLYTQTRSLYWDSLVRQFTGQWDVLRERIEVAISMATEHGFALVLGVGPIMRGWALVTEGRAEEGIRQISQGLERYRATGAGFQLPHLLTSLIEAYNKIEQPEEGLTTLAEAQALVETTGERYYEAELERLKGELLLAQSPDDPAEAEACFHNALEIARRQQAKSLELRAAMSLTRLWQRQGKKGDACRLLNDVFAWFTEGFDTADLREARALLDELGAMKQVGISRPRAAE